MVDLIDKSSTIDLSTTGAGSCKKGNHVHSLKTYEDVNREVSAFKQTRLVKTKFLFFVSKQSSHKRILPNA